MSGLRAAVLAMICLPAAARAAVMASADLELSASVFDMAGAPDLAGGGLSVSYSAGAQEGGEAAGSGGILLSGGFYGALWIGGAAGLSALSLVGGGCYGYVPREAGGTLVGIPVSQAVCLEFNESMLPTTVYEAIRVRLERDKDGGSVEIPATVRIASVGGDFRSFSVEPSAGWEGNALYEVSVGTAAAGSAGRRLSASATFQFLTQADPSVENTFVAAADPATRLTVRAGVLPSAGHVEISTFVAHDASAVDGATAKLRANGDALARVHLIREINYYDALNQLTDLSFTPGMATLRLPYAGAAAARAENAGVYYLDEAGSLWVRAPDASAAGDGSSVSASPPHLSVFALIGTADSSVDDAYAYPVPFRPHGPDAGTGAGQTGTEASGITFTNLPSQAVVEVYNVRGERVWRGEENTWAGKLVWGARGESGGPVASGVYIYVVKSGSDQKKLGKLAIIR